ncbi:hypothetical protein [Haloarchaeobius sp. DFWS5]|uniref:hypothetical protein n=1 Tax=Haloarchaeobius sp. DFWS5 TaxID=3446114 RepID=UPI003EBFA49D
MQAKTPIAVFAVLGLLLATVVPAAAAAGPTQTNYSTDDGLLSLSDLPDDNTTNETDDNTTTNVTDNVTNETETGDNFTDNTTDDNFTSNQSSEDAMNEFVQKLHSYIDSVKNDTNVSAPGRLISGWVLAHNPGNAPDHAGPPSDTPPGQAGKTNNSSQGPPADVPGQRGNETASNGPGDKGNNGHGSDKEKGNNGNGPKKAIETFVSLLSFD